MSARAQPRPTPDLLVLGAALSLLVLGVMMVYSASFVVAESYFLTKQAIMATVGLAAMITLTITGYHWLERFSAPAMALALAGLVVVLLPGVSADKYGAHRWIGLGALPELQPSEFAKLAMIIYMSSWLARMGRRVSTLTRGFVPFAMMLALVVALVMAEPDMGTSFVIAVTAACVFFVAGANLLHFFVVGLAGVAGFAYLAVAAGYRQDRLLAFLNPWSDQMGTGWHTIQTLIALGSGGITGLGLGASRQKFYYVPNAHTDAIFAIIGEELGFVGAAGVILLFALLTWRGFVIALRAPDQFGRLLATGVTCLIIVQALTNIAVVTNSVPYTGITLPFISYGGSSLLVTLAGVGLLLAVSRYSRSAPPAKKAAIRLPAAATAGRDQAGGRYGRNGSAGSDRPTRSRGRRARVEV